ncbi:MAG: class I SAM-dependent methyltransferase [Pseudomonas sp.]
MNISDLMGLFGAYTPGIVLLAGIFFAGVIVVAFRQGRSISIWPPKFGPPAGVDPVSPGDETPADRPLPAGSVVAAVDREYTVDRAREFYEQIAPYYDLRNSGNLVSTHLETVAQIQAIRARKPALRVLDLGGGTGKLIAIHFFNDEMIAWSYVDFCPAMAERFRRNLAGHPLGRNAEIIVEDLTVAVRQLRAASYDVVLLSLVLSSMPTLPDFASIARLLIPGGSLIVTDISPGYTHANPAPG